MHSYAIDQSLSRKNYFINSVMFQIPSTYWLYSFTCFKFKGNYMYRTAKKRLECLYDIHMKLSKLEQSFLSV